jgi:hypothetical protein
MATNKERWFNFFNLFDADKSGDISKEDIPLGIKVKFYYFIYIYVFSNTMY